MKLQFMLSEQQGSLLENIKIDAKFRKPIA
jgi:hypothetical protein